MLPRDAVPLENILVRVGDHAGLQRNQRVRNLEGRGRQLVSPERTLSLAMIR